jgi:hypothetical protein
VWKVFGLGPLEHARKFFLPYADTFLPVWSLWVVDVSIPFVELGAGALVIIGLRTRAALGSTPGLLVSNALAILVGKLMGRRLPAKYLRYGTAIIFIALGLFAFFEAYKHR